MVRMEVLAFVVLVASLWFAGEAVAKPSATHKFEIEPGSFQIVPSTLQAGAHADWTTTFNFRHNGNEETYNDLKDTVVNLPAGFVGSNTAVPTCSAAQLVNQVSVKGGSGGCPPASQVGTISLDLNLGSPEGPVFVTFPVFNMEPTSYGVTAELGFNVIVITQIVNVSVRPGDSGLTVRAPDSTDDGEPHNVSITVWGVPGSTVHDAERGEECYPHNLETTTVICEGGGEKLTGSTKPFLANPSSCGAFDASIQADSWEEPLAPPSTTRTEVGPIVGCERVPFTPSIKMQPTTDSAESPSGLSLLMEVPQSWSYSNSFATSTLKDTKVTLPLGYTINPSAGNGLVGCTPTQYEAETAFSRLGAGCPSESNLGKVNIETPLLSEPIKGDVYIAQPYDNPFGSLLAIYIVGKAPDRGIIIKAAGRIEPDPVTGQLTTTFEDTPQQPFSRLTLELKQGQTSPLVSPPVCGVYTVDAVLTPWSSVTLPGEIPVEPRSLSTSFKIEHGIGSGPCPTGGTPPFSPSVIAGMNNNAAGSYSTFYLRVERKDGEQEITGFSTLLPPGLTGNLSGIPFCGEAEIQHAREQSGVEAEASPACPTASQIGRSVAEAGVGSVLAQAPGRLYLGGPFDGAPFSIVSVTSAHVGPFDLGTVVVHLPLMIDPVTAQVSIPQGPADQIPHIIKGIVIHVRDIRVYVDRERFMLNPTSCDPMSVSATVIGGGADPTNMVGYNPVTGIVRFQDADCANLHFKPLFRASVSGKTSRKNGASLRVTLAYPKAPLGTQANVHTVKVELPKQLPSRLETLQKACAYTVFTANPAACPAASKVGFAKAITPILPVPLEGPAYFVSHGGAKFPELIIVLQGYGVTIDLHGETFISKGITSSTFRSVPDQPVTSFELILPKGLDSALAANGNLCKVTRTIKVHRHVTRRIKGRLVNLLRNVKRTVSGKLRMPTVFTAQNGTVIHQTTLITVTGCGKKKTARKRRAKR